MLCLQKKITELQDQFDEYQTTPIEELSICTSDTDIEIFFFGRGGMLKLFDVYLTFCKMLQKHY